MKHVWIAVIALALASNAAWLHADAPGSRRAFLAALAAATMTGPVFAATPANVEVYQVTAKGDAP